MELQQSNLLLPDKLASRANLISLLDQVLDSGEEVMIPLIWNFWASRGGGKTAFLLELQKYFTSRLDLTLLGMWDAQSMPSEQLIAEISAPLTGLTTGQKKLIFVDNLDALLRQGDSEAFFTFERDVVLQLMGREDVLMITTSQVELRQWHDSEVRARQINYHLPLLSPDEVAEKVQAWHLDPGKAQTWTLGHPQLLSWLRVCPEIEESALVEKAEAYFLEGLSEARRELASKVSLFPVFNVAVLQEISPDDAGKESEGFYTRHLDAIRELGRVGLVSWDGEAGAYRFTDSAVRQLLSRSFKQHHPEEFKAIHTRASGYYKTEASHASYLQYNLVSAVYHLAQAHSDRSTKEIASLCQTWVQESLGSWMGANWSAVIQAWETGSGDIGVIDEMSTLMGKEVFDLVARLLRESKTRMEEMVA